MIVKLKDKEKRGVNLKTFLPVRARLLALASLFCLVAQPAIAAKTTTYYYSDLQGSTLATTDAQGNIVSSDDYRSYGSPASGSPGDGVGFASHIGDSDSGLIYMQARYYDPSIGRFLSVDMVLPAPAALDLMNRYAYVANNPMSFSDPTGMFPQNMSSADINCEVYHCQRSGDATRKTDAVSLGVPKNTPAGMTHYFTDTSPAGRVAASGAVMDYFKINYGGLQIVYVAQLSAVANAAVAQDGILRVGPDLFSHSFGLIGAILSHEVEGHWDTQIYRSTSLKQDNQSFWMREVQAYDMELSPRNVVRFGLTPQEVSSEMNKRDRYFNGLNSDNKGMISNHHIYTPLGN